MSYLLFGLLFNRKHLHAFVRVMVTMCCNVDQFNSDANFRSWSNREGKFLKSAFARFNSSILSDTFGFHKELSFSLEFLACSNVA